MVSPLHHITWMQEYHRDWFRDPLCFWCISTTSLMVPFQELEFMQMILLHIPAYKHLASLIGLRWQQSWRRTCIVLLSGIIQFCQDQIAVCESILIPLKMNDFELPKCPSFHLLGVVFTPKLDWKDTLHLRPLCTSIKPPSAHVSSTAPIFGVVFHNWVALRRLVNIIGTVLSSILQPLSDRRVVASLSLLYKYCHVRCSLELSSIVLHRHFSIRLIQFSESLHQYAVDIPRCKRNFYHTGFCPRTATLLSLQTAFRNTILQFNRFLLPLHCIALELCVAPHQLVALALLGVISIKKKIIIMVGKTEFVW